MTDQNRKLPIDRGWAWVILLASSIQMFIILGQMKCYGIFFVLLQQKFGSSSSMTSLVFLVQELAFSFTAFFVSTFGRKVSYRIASVTGSIIATSMYLLIGFSETMTLVYLAAVGLGISNGFLFPAAYAMVSTYFEKRRGFANSVCNGGLSMGGLILAPFYTMIIEHYGFTGTYLFVAGVHLNIVASGMLLRPLEFYMRTKRKRGDCAIESNDSYVKERERFLSNLDDDKSDFIKVEKCVNETSVAKDEDKGMLNTQTYELNGKQNVLTSGEGNSLLVQSQERCNYLNQNTHVEKLNQDGLAKDALNHENDNKKEIYSDKHSVVRRFLSKFVNIETLKDSCFVYYLVANVFLCAGNSLVPGYVPPHAFELGVPPEKIAWMVSGPAIVDLVFRPIFGFLSDTGWIRRTTMIAVSSGIIGIGCQIFYLLTSFETIMPFSLTLALSQGIYYSLFVVVLLEIIAMEELKGALGFTCFIQGLSNAFGLLLAGLIRDHTGSYISTYNFIGSLLLVGAVMIYFLPAIHRRTKRRREKEDSES